MPSTTICVKCLSKGDIISKSAAILGQQLKQRCNINVSHSGKAELTVQLRLKPELGINGYAISQEAATITIEGGDQPGVLYGVGRFLRDGTYHSDGFQPGPWRGQSTPTLPVRGIYFATHFHNFYHDAPIEEVQRYVEELALWGVNSLMVWFDMHHYHGINDPAAQQMIHRLRLILQTAKSVGMGRGLGVIGNEGYANSPVAMRSKGPGRGGYYGVEICPNQPGAKQQIVGQFRELFEQFKDIGITDMWIWPYDQGSCSCEKCQPWGSNGFLSIAKPVADQAHSSFPGVKVYLSTWYFDETEWQGLAEAFRVRPSWLDALISEPGSAAFTKSSPGGLPALGFPEISMNGMWPWGGFGANPQPAALQRYWDAVGKNSMGGYPYSEGIFEDINKVICAQLYWNPDASIEEIMKSYIAYEFTPELQSELLMVLHTLEQNHHFRWWPGLFEDYEGWFPTKGIAPQSDPGAEAAYEAVKQADTQLTPYARKSWRWRVVYLRALLDAELKMNGGKPNLACERAFRELTRIYHAENGQIDVKPPAAG
ncbi:MAG: hypothetical protein ACYC1M_17395 [Armatimonadota bacterium]